MCHNCFEDKPMSEFRPIVDDTPGCIDCFKKNAHERYRLSYERKKALHPTDFDDPSWQVRALAESLKPPRKPYTEGDIKDVIICLDRGVLRGDIHLVARIPRYRVKRILSEERHRLGDIK